MLLVNYASFWQVAVCEVHSTAATQINIVRTKGNIFASQRYDLRVAILYTAHYSTNLCFLLCGLIYRWAACKGKFQTQNRCSLSPSLFSILLAARFTGLLLHKHIIRYLFMCLSPLFYCEHQSKTLTLSYSISKPESCSTYTWKELNKLLNELNRTGSSAWNASLFFWQIPIQTSNSSQMLSVIFSPAASGRCDCSFLHDSTQLHS